MKKNNAFKVILLHGNGDSSPQDNWFPYVKAELEKENIEVITPQLPDAPLCRAKYWLPILENELKADKNSILIGHSTGAIAAMRFAESNKILGSVLIGSYYSDLGMESEKKSGYFDKPWDWQTIKDNQEWSIIFASTDDPWIPIDEPRVLRKKLDAEYYEYNDQGHFGGDYHKPTFPELVAVIKKKLLNV